MATLNNLQKSQVISREHNIAADKLLEYIQKFDNLSLDDFPQMDENKKSYIKEKLNNMPNPNEQKEWGDIVNMLGTPTQELLSALNAYIRNWETSRPAGNHVDEAWNEVSRVESELSALQAQIEEDDWNNVDVLDQTSLIGHLTKYPQTIHKTEIDDSVWGLVNREDVQEIQNYLTIFPYGIHVAEAQKILNAVVEWNNVKNSNDILSIHYYIIQNPNSPFRQQASLLLARLKQMEIKLMKNSPQRYETIDLIKYLNEGIFSDSELIQANVVTKGILDNLRNPDMKYNLPDINKAIRESSAECNDGYTDVFFFGIPSTGKTCVLMGLSRSNSLHVNLAAGGGDYAAALQQYTDMGVCVPPTPGDFVTTLEAKVNSRNHKGAVHKVNLVEMSGEEFAFGIAYNPDHVFTFEEMGSGSTELLRNNNRKVFFLVIDPTTNIAHARREIFDGYNEETGEKTYHLEVAPVNQRIAIQKMVDLFIREENRDIMKKVDSIHIIMTKADMLGDAIERNEKACNIFYERFAEDILEPLHELCEEFNINSNTRYYPKLYPFSLGSFYVGGFYEYDTTDSNKLVKAILNATHGVVKKTLWTKIKEILN